MAKCAILIDGGYLDKVLENDFSRARVDIGKLGDELAGPDERLRTYLCHCMPYVSAIPTEDEKKRYSAYDRYISALKRLPRFQFRQGKLQKTPDGFRQKRVDILIAVDIVRMSSNRQIDRVVLIAGDSDLVPAIEAARDAGVVVTLYYSRNSVHNELLQSCDERIEITHNLVNRIKAMATVPPPASGTSVVAAREACPAVAAPVAAATQSV
jgi:uncharacterized LabA/DUF88 family protein